MPFAIYRHEKIKTAQALTASANHMTRAADTPNADPTRAALNRVLIGSADPAADAAALIPAPDAVDEGGKKRRRSNSVLAIEILLTASPEWWAEATPAAQQDWLDRSTEWLVREYGRENIAHLRLHGDEQTPHLTGFIVPLDKAGHLNARKWIGGAARCRQQQTDYAAAVAPLGLSRGIEGSTAEHERVRRHYGQIAAPVAPLQIERPPRVLMNPEAWAQEQAENIAKQMAPTIARARTAESDRTARKAAEATAEKERRKRERTEKALVQQKGVADRMRVLPLPDVLDALGFQQDKAERDRWKAEGFNITLATGPKAGKWFDHLAQHGRGGAIDLVQHVTGADFKGALSWLADRFGEGATAADLTARMRAEAVRQVKEAKTEREPFTAPSPIPEHWPRVRKYLVEERALPAPYIDKLHQQGDCYADARRNAVFICRDAEGRAVGAELKGTIQRSDGTRFSGMTPGSAKDAGGFRIGSIAKAAVIYLVESAIDAISLAKLRATAGEKSFAIISTAGTTPNPRAWLAGIADKVKRVCAFDNDSVGDKAADGLRRHRFERLRPTGKDWNDDLKAARRAAGEGTTTKAVMDVLRRPDASPPPETTPEVDDSPSPF